MDISSLMKLSSLTNSNLSNLNSTELSSLAKLQNLAGLTEDELESIASLSSSGLSSVTGISGSALKTATESFSTVLKDTLEEVQQTGTLSEETQEELGKVVSVLESTKSDSSTDNTAYELYKELFSSSQGRKNVQEIVQSGFNNMIFDSGEITTGLNNMSAIISALENTNEES